MKYHFISHLSMKSLWIFSCPTVPVIVAPKMSPKIQK